MIFSTKISRFEIAFFFNLAYAWLVLNYFAELPFGQSQEKALFI
jgi:hypothetical protein